MWFIHYNILYSLYFLCQPIRKIYFIHIHFIKLVKHSRMLSNQIHVHYFGIRWMKIHCRFRWFCCLFIWNVFIRFYLSVYEDGEKYINDSYGSTTPACGTTKFGQLFSIRTLCRWTLFPLSQYFFPQSGE